MFPRSHGASRVLATAHLVLLTLFLAVSACQHVAAPTGSSDAVPDADALGRVATPMPAGNAPVLAIMHPYMEPVVSTSLDGTPPKILCVSSGESLSFCWTATSAAGEAPIRAYRTGWDIVDMNDPEGWETDYIPWGGEEVCSTPRTFYFGTHTFSVEAIDENDNASRATVLINLRPGPVSFDILPGSCRNPLSANRNGVLPAAIAGTAALDVRDIDVSSVHLWIDGQVIQPVMSRFADVASPSFECDGCTCPGLGADGIDDLFLKFPAAEILDALGAVSRRESREILVTGFMNDGSDFGLKDCVTIVGHAKHEKQPAPRRDAVLETLEFAYNNRNLESVAGILDDDFVFHFAESDVAEGNVPVSQWDRASELAATAKLFDAFATSERRDARSDDPLSHVAAVEDVTWGRIKVAFWSGIFTGPTTIDLALYYPPGEETWVAVAPDPVFGDDLWYQKVADYRMVVQVGDFTFVNGSAIPALFTVRFDESKGSWQLVDWRDEIE